MLLTASSNTLLTLQIKFNFVDKDANELTTKIYTLKLLIDSSKIYVSSTTKRETNAEGNPSLADAASGIVSDGRYIKNDNNLVTTTLYPPTSEQEEKIIYTTKEFYDSYYSIKIEIEACEEFDS